MRFFVVSLLSLAVVGAPRYRADRKEQLFATWQEAQRNFKSLVVEFTLERKDTVFNERHKARGALRLLRTPKGEYFGSYELAEEKPEGDKGTGLLMGGSIYLLNHDKKSAIRFVREGNDLREFLEKYFNPFVILLDQKRAAGKCTLEITKKDKWYTYLAVKPKKVRRYGWFPDTFHDGRAVLMNKSSDDIPRDMPCQLWYTDGHNQFTFEIKVWRLNAANAPTIEEFVKPEDRLGWEVSVVPFDEEKNRAD